jgi:hypothetical protein
MHYFLGRQNCQCWHNFDVDVHSKVQNLKVVPHSSMDSLGVCRMRGHDSVLADPALRGEGYAGTS